MGIYGIKILFIFENIFGSINKKTNPIDSKITLHNYILYKGEPSYVGIFAGSLESANSSILAPCDLFKEVVRKKSGFYVN